MARPTLTMLAPPPGDRLEEPIRLDLLLSEEETPEETEDLDFALTTPGSGPGGEWTDDDWALIELARLHGWRPLDGLGDTEGTLADRLRAVVASRVLQPEGAGQPGAGVDNVRLFWPVHTEQLPKQR